MARARVIAAGAAGLAVALLLAWLAAKDDAVQPSAGNAPVRTSPPSVRGPPAVDTQSPATPATVQPAPRMAPQAAGAGMVVPITVLAPRTLRVGEMQDLVIGLDVRADVGEIGFTVQFDANVLQVRAGTEGNWSAGAGVSFTADISSAEDRVRIRSVVSGRPAGGTVAVVQFQAVAPGTTSVVISDVTVKDLAGNAMPFALSTSILQVTSESLPPAHSSAGK